MTRKDGKVSANPLATQGGQGRRRQAFADLGVLLPLTEKSGDPQMARTSWTRSSSSRGPYSRVKFAQVVKGIVGNRTIYQTVGDRLVGDRVHPGVPRPSQRQAVDSTLASPCFGKRGGKVTERAILLSRRRPRPHRGRPQPDRRSRGSPYTPKTRPTSSLHWRARLVPLEIAEMVQRLCDARDAKAIGHGWNYGMGLKGIAYQAKVDGERRGRVRPGHALEVPAPGPVARRSSRAGPSRRPRWTTAWAQAAS